MWFSAARLAGAFAAPFLLLRNIDSGTGVPYGLGNDDRKSTSLISPEDFRFGR